MVDVQVRAEHEVDVFEAQPGSVELVEPALLGKVERRRMPFVLAGAGVNQHGVMRRPHYERLIRDHHAVGCLVEHEVRHLG